MKYVLLNDDGARWPVDTGDYDDSVQWTLRYGTPTRATLLAAADLIAAYQHLLTHPTGTTSVVNVLRSLRRKIRKGEFA